MGYALADGRGAAGVEGGSGQRAGEPAVAAEDNRAPRDLRRGDVSRVQAAVQTLRPVHRGGGSG